MRALQWVMAISLITFPVLVSGQPAPGSWTAPDDFAAGTWEEVLWGGSEGAVGNEVTASSAGLFDFRGAELDEVVLVSAPVLPDQPYFLYETTYIGGEVTLANPPDAPWNNPCDEATRFRAPLRESVVTTWKYVDRAGQPTGQTAFRLDTTAWFGGSPPVGAHITAGFRGEPVLGGSGTPEDPFTVGGDLTHVAITVLGPATVPLDIKPGSCPNPINCNSRGVVPVAIVSDGTFDVRDINVRSIRVAGVPPMRIGYEDVATPYIPDCGELDQRDCMTEGPDGLMDMTLKFATWMFCHGLGRVHDGDVIRVELEARLMDGTPIKGSDVVRIKMKKPPKNVR